MKKTLLLIFTLIVSILSLPSMAAMLSEYDPALQNRQNQMQLRDFKIEKKKIQTTEDDIKREKKPQLDEKEIKDKDVTYNPQFHLSQIIYEGNTVIKTEILDKMAEDLINKNIFLSDIQDLTLKISRYYQQKGFLTSYAYIPTQNIEDGIVTITIKESIVASRSVEGNKWEREWFFNENIFYAKGVKENQVFNIKDFQSAMKNLNKEDYIKGYAELSKDDNDDTLINLHVTDRIPLNVNLSWDDYGRNYTGRQKFVGIIGSDNFLGFGDKTYSGAILSKGSKGALAGYQIPINKHGTKLAFDYSYSKVNLGGPYKQYGINGDSTDYSIKVIHPLISTATKELTASVSVDAMNSKNVSKALGQTLSDYSLRVLKTYLYGQVDDNYGRTFGNIGLSFGTNGLGASPNLHNGPQSSFYKLNAGLTRILVLPKNCMGIVRLNGQYSPQALYSSEQMFLGGESSIRGYQPSELLGDYGVSGSFEVRTPVWGLHKILPEPVKNWSDKIRLAAFYDWGYVKEHKRLYEYPNNFISSVGVGTYINLTDSIYAELGIGIPVGVKNYNQDNARFYFSINTDLDRMLLKPKKKEAL